MSIALLQALLLSAEAYNMHVAYQWVRHWGLFPSTTPSLSNIEKKTAIYPVSVMSCRDLRCAVFPFQRQRFGCQLPTCDPQLLHCYIGWDIICQEVPWVPTFINDELFHLIPKTCADLYVFSIDTYSCHCMELSIYSSRKMHRFSEHSLDYDIEK